jgi:hypothetical protein
MRKPASLLLATVALAASFGASAGTVDVAFVNAERFTDAGTSSWDEVDNLKALTGYLQSLGQRLPGNQSLKIEVLDVDLAGDVRPSRRDAEPIRVMRGRTDFPRFHVRYTLSADGRVLRTGEERVTDVNYGRGLPVHRDFSGLAYEKRMLESWVRARFVDDLRASN